MDDAESLILDDKKYIKNIGKKTQTISEIQGQFIGLMKFQNDGLTNLIDFYENAKNLSIQGTNLLNPNLPFEKSFMTDLLQGLVDHGNKIKAIPIHNGWLEVDSIDDYELYNKMNENGSLSQFFSIS